MSQPQPDLGRGSTYSTPRWVKLFGVILLVLIVLVGIMLLSGGEHGPGRHLPPSHVAEVESSTQQP
jgi:hypothetical protein